MTEKQDEKQIKDQTVESTEEVVEEKSTKEVAKSAKSEVKKANPRSKKYAEVKKLVDKNKLYSATDAIELVKKTSMSSFDGSVELHLRLMAKKGAKAGRIEPVRGLIEFPHNTGKKVKVEILDEAMVEKINKEKKTEFDVLLATPDMMPKIARLAKILGPSGKMPNPKAGTVTTDPQETKKKIEAGRIEYKSDKNGIIHIVIGKVSYDKEKLQENYSAIMSKIAKDKLQSVNMCATMGPSVKIAL